MPVTKLLHLAILFAASAASSQSSLGGEWKVHNNVFGSEMDRICAFQQKERELSGTCGAGTGTVKVTGTVDGKRVTWRFQTREGNDTVTMEYAGTLLEETRIVGSITVVEAGVDGEFTATRTKPGE